MPKDETAQAIEKAAADTANSPTYWRRRLAADLDDCNSMYAHEVRWVNQELIEKNQPMTEQTYRSISANVTAVENGQRSESVAHANEVRTFFSAAARSFWEACKNLGNGSYAEAGTAAKEGALNLSGVLLNSGATVINPAVLNSALNPDDPETQVTVSFKS